ncbi:Hypothetical protein RAK1035_2520 [Roseovarius sp. AK1035]|nr:Hypothetical protein RAK1035_2520 [Roseovarius sp. AK1035]
MRAFVQIAAPRHGRVRRAALRFSKGCIGAGAIRCCPRRE